MIGIYKITSPIGKIYIGQSIDIHNRFLKYKNNCRTQTKLKRSFIKYGFDNHSFEILCECNIYELNKKERYYQDFYDSVNKGLNCRATKTNDKSGYLSDETKINVSVSKKGIGKGREPWNKGKKCPQISIALKGKQAGKNNPRYGSKQSEYNKKMSSIANLGRKHSKEINLSKGRGAREVLCLCTGVFYRSYFEASVAYNIKPATLLYYLNGKRKNKTSLVFA